MSAPEPEPGGLPQVLRAAGSVIAPATVLTGVLFYFGWNHQYWYFRYFGISSTMLGLTVEDYLVRSADVLFVPIMVTAALGLGVYWLHRLLGDRVRAHSKAVAIVAAVAGGLLSMVGLLNVFRVRLLDYSLLPQAFLLLGVLLLIYAGRLRRQAGIGLAEWAAVFVILSLTVFWAAVDYSASVGVNRGRATEASLAHDPGLILYSEKSLSIVAPGVTETRCKDPDAAYRFRYDGLKLVLQSGNQLVLLPAGWRRGGVPALVIPRKDTLRLDFATGPPSGPPAC